MRPNTVLLALFALALAAFPAGCGQAPTPSAVAVTPAEVDGLKLASPELVRALHDAEFAAGQGLHEQAAEVYASAIAHVADTAQMQRLVKAITHARGLSSTLSADRDRYDKVRADAYAKLARSSATGTFEKALAYAQFGAEQGMHPEAATAFEHTLTRVGMPAEARLLVKALTRASGLSSTLSADRARYKDLAVRAQAKTLRKGEGDPEG